MAWISLIVGLALIWWLLKLGRGPLFDLRLAHGKLTMQKGKVPPAFITQLEQILKRESLRGRIRGVRDGDGVRLVFSRSIPEPIAQRVRNVFPYGDYRSSLPTPPSGHKRH